MKKPMVVGASVLLLGSTACTGPVNDETVREMPTGYMCRILDSSQYISLPSEQKAIYRELERRGERCEGNAQRVIVQKDY